MRRGWSGRSRRSRAIATSSTAPIAGRSTCGSATRSGTTASDEQAPASSRPTRRSAPGSTACARPAGPRPDRRRAGRRRRPPKPRRGVGLTAARLPTTTRPHQIDDPRRSPMSDIRLGALCWNQYTTWPALLEAGIRADRLGYDTLWTWDHLYPIVGQPRRPDPRGLADPGRLGAGHRADPDRADGRREHVPRAGAHREDGDDPRPHLRRPRDPRHRRRPGSRRSTRRTASRSATASRSGCAGSARRCRSCAACSTASARRRPVRATRRGACGTTRRRVQAAPAAADRWWRRAGDAQARRALRRRQQRRRRDRERPAQGGDPPPALRDGRPRPGGDRADDRPRHGHHPRLARPRRERVQPRSSSATAGPSPGRTSRSGRPRTSPSCSRRSSSIGYRHLIAGFPSPYDEESMTRLATEVRPMLEAD